MIIREKIIRYGGDGICNLIICARSHLLLFVTCLYQLNLFYHLLLKALLIYLVARRKEGKKKKKTIGDCIASIIVNNFHGMHLLQSLSINLVPSFICSDIVLHEIEFRENGMSKHIIQLWNCLFVFSFTSYY